MFFEHQNKNEDFCILMHKNIPVAKLEIDDNGNLTKLFKVYNADHLPYFSPKEGLNKIKAYLRDWLKNRSIPDTRPQLNEILSYFKKLNVRTQFYFIKKSMGLSLSDQYWICLCDNQMKWEDVNFFTNNFSKDLGYLMLKIYEPGYKRIQDYNLMSPDSTCDGFLPKMWKDFGPKRKLLKGGRIPYYQETFNEVIASKLMNKLNIPHVEYEIHYLEIDKKQIPFCACECFITPETEYITASQFTKNNIGKPDDITIYQYYINCCKEVGIKDAQLRIDQMIVVDFLMANEDRHGNNYGLIRNVETLDFVDIAPIFDTGNSLWYEKETYNIPCKVICKPFANRHYEQIKFVENFDWLDLSKLKDFETEVFNILKENPFDKDNRAKVLSENIKNRIELLQKYINKRHDPEFDTHADKSFNIEMESFGDEFYDPYEKY